ncbi:5-oxoprolinase subunit PxpA [Corynebacterium poyangense]|uniref:5-oxoprolinase subunit PxpA n=1 Tax=Corynebacterium poyangense TaxID=2684405 RepID=A0A7H0SRD1_9CORY|nr:5-oxoprolinase subunit PxpA [Corynebacterium poyangense]MBZ8176540.1 5-oxoprolinase subunit PxpA [Corynebacterium poyangense]QNQ91106.1 5-oxoprolinase subunit PxpA [Corynebacterium poyangense]
MTVTINSDLGEGIGLHSFGNDEELLNLIDVANVACGFHASDPQIMEHTVAIAFRQRVAVGAHPGFPDLVGFGRRAISMTPDEVENMVRYQVGALSAFLDKYDLPLNHIKPHGALYGVASQQPEVMAAIARVARDYSVPVFGLAGTLHQEVAEELGVGFVGELYVDLDYSAAGELLIKRKPQPIDPAAAAERVARALETGKVTSVEGTEVEISFNSICVHSDPYNAADVVRALKNIIH